MIVERLRGVYDWRAALAGSMKGHLQGCRMFVRVAQALFRSADRQARFAIASATLACVLAGLLQSVAPIFLSVALRPIVPSGVPGSVVVFVGLFAAARIAGQLLVDVRWIILNPVLYKVVYRLGEHFPQTLVEALGLKAFDDGAAGPTAERVAVVQRTQLAGMTVLQQTLVSILPTCVELSTVVVVLFVTIGASAGLILAFGILVFALSATLGRQSETDQLERALAADAGVATAMGEYISRSFLANQFDCGNFFKDRLRDRIDLSLDRHGAYFRTRCFRSLFRTAASLGCYILAIALIAADDRSGWDVAQIFLLIYYIDRIFMPLNAMALSVNSVGGALTTFRIGEELLAAAGSKEDISVRFQSQEAIYAKLNDVLDETGSWIRLRGPSGAGKTVTLRNWYTQIKSGAGKSKAPRSIIYLGHDVAAVDGTVGENILLGRHSTDKLNDLFDGFWRPLRRNGSGVTLDSAMAHLSGGERQMMTVIRAILRNPDILILDESTGAMDIAVEQATLERIRQTTDTTVIFVSHRDQGGVHFSDVLHLEAVMNL